MKTIFRYGVFVAVMAACGMVFAAEKTAFDPAARAKVISPFIEDRTIIVAHVDFTRVDIGATLDQIGQLAPEAQMQMAMGKTVGSALQATFKQSGGKDAYICITVAGPLGEAELYYVVMPLAPGANQEVLTGMIRQCNPKAFTAIERIGDVLLAGTRSTVDRLKSVKPEDRAGLLPRVEKAFEAAGDTTAQVLVLPPLYTGRVVAELMPTLPTEIGGGPSSVLTDGLLWAAVGVDLPPKLAVRAVIQSQNATAAAALREKLIDFSRIAATRKEVREVLPKFDEIVKILTPEVQGDRLVLTLDDTSRGVATLVNAIKPGVETARRSHEQAEAMNNPRRLALAMHNYNAAHKSFPAAASYDAQGKPLLSWRVLILPYLDGGKDLYKQFHLNEPWDSEHNKKLIERMPTFYRSPGSKLKDPGRTNYVVVTGKGTVFDGPKGTPIKEIKDGTGNTIMVVEADDDHAVIWTKPDDLPFDAKQPNKGLGGLWDDGKFYCSFCNGSAHRIRRDIDPDTLRWLFLRDDGKPIDFSKF